MYTSPGHRYVQRSSSYTNQAQSSSGYSPTKGYAGYASSSSAMSFDDHKLTSSRHQGQYYSPPLKAQGYSRNYSSSSAYGSDYYNNNNSFYAQETGTTFYHSSSSTASSSQDGYYGDDLDDFEELRSAFSMRPDADPEMTTVPTVPTPLSLSLYEVTKTPSGRVLVTSSNQTIEFFSCAVNAPSRCVYVAE